VNCPGCASRDVELEGLRELVRAPAAPPSDQAIAAFRARLWEIDHVKITAYAAREGLIAANQVGRGAPAGEAGNGGPK
jgi:hypothetical protein